MPTRRFDGATIEEALAAVRAGLGPDAKIAGAEKVRTGGLGGFFAKERVEVTVEVDDDVAPATASPVAPAPAPRPEPAAAPAPSAVAPKPAPASLLDLADSVSDEEHDASTESTTFASVLKRIASDADAAVTAQTALDPPPRPAPAPTPTPPVTDFEPIRPTVEVTAARMPAPAPMLTAVRRASRQPAPEAAKLTQLGVPGPFLPADLSHGLHCALVDAMSALPQPPPLPTGKGSVLAVVGERAAALGIARDLSAAIDLDPEDVVICGPRRRGRSAHTWLELTMPGDAGEHRRSWRWRMHPTVVVVDAPVGRPNPWALDMLAALEPTSAWGVTDAGRKLEDVAAWSAQVGGLDAIALNGTDDTVSPASILHLGVPIALVDGEPATPEIWAGLLMERLAA